MANCVLLLIEIITSYFCWYLYRCDSSQQNRSICICFCCLFIFDYILRLPFFPVNGGSQLLHNAYLMLTLPFFSSSLISYVRSFFRSRHCIVYMCALLFHSSLSHSSASRFEFAVLRFSYQFLAYSRYPQTIQFVKCLFFFLCIYFHVSCAFLVRWRCIVYDAFVVVSTRWERKIWT